MPTLETVVGYAPNPAAVFTALTPGAGQTFSVRDFPATSMAYLEALWGQNATAGELRVRSPKMHDDQQGIRVPVNAAQVFNSFGTMYGTRVYPNDPLRVDMTGGAAETDVGAMNIYYEQADALNQRIEMWETIKPRIVDLMGQVVAVAGPVVPGDWSAGTAINATNDNLKADTDYAWLGYLTNTECAAIAVAGTDTSNIKLGGPGELNPMDSRDFFIQQSRHRGTPHIPVINSNNRGNTLVHVAKATAGGTVNVTLILARLSR